MLYLYQQTINTHLKSQLDAEKNTETIKLNSELESAKKSTTDTEAQLQMLRSNLDNYSDKSIEHLHNLETKEQKTTYLRNITDNKNQFISDQKKLLTALEIKQKDKNAEIESKLKEMTSLYDYQKNSGISGISSFLENLNSGYERLKSELADIDQRIKDINSNILTTQLRLQDSPLLTLDEQNKKSYLKAEMDRLQKQHEEYSKNVDQLNKNILGLNEKFSLLTRDDSLTQTRVLYEIILENPRLRIEIIALLFLLIFIETLPIFIKLIVHTNYDNYLRQLTEENISSRKV